jgi:nicotinamidase-related amidase
MTVMATALCVVDMLNPYDHEDADRLSRNVEPVVEPLAELAERAVRGERPDLIEPLLPPEGAFLLAQREIDHIVLAGQVTEQCILYSALDAYVRHVREAAFEMMERNMRAELVSCADARLGD